jgi:hypothetical protein
MASAAFFVFDGFPLARTAQQRADRDRKATTGAEALVIKAALRGAKAPLFHGCARICDFQETLKATPLQNKR